MFYIPNNIQYRVVRVPADGHWSFLMHYDTLSDAQRHCDSLIDHPLHDGDRYHVTRIGAADSLSAGFSDVPPAAV